MSKIVTFEQANRLEKLGYDTTKLTITTVNGLFTHTERPIPVHEALDWIREEKNIPCSVHLEFEENNKEWFYYGEYGIKGDNRVYDTETFDTHPLAESALLDSLLTYLEKK